MALGGDNDPVQMIALCPNCHATKTRATKREDLKQILLATQMNAADDDPDSSAIFDVGTLANVLQLLKLPDGTVKVLVEGTSRAKIARFDDQLFAEASWLAVFLGQGIAPRDYDRLADVPARDDVVAALRRIGRMNADIASRLPAHDAFIAATCGAEGA